MYFFSLASIALFGQQNDSIGLKIALDKHNPKARHLMLLLCDSNGQVLDTIAGLVNDRRTELLGFDFIDTFKFSYLTFSPTVGTMFTYTERDQQGNWVRGITHLFFDQYQSAYDPNRPVSNIHYYELKNAMTVLGKRRSGETVETFDFYLDENGCPYMNGKIHVCGLLWIDTKGVCGEPGKRY